MTHLDALIQEIIDFSNLIAYNENPADRDLHNACCLFGDYLSGQLQAVRQGMIGPASNQSMRWSAQELNALRDLIQRPKLTPADAVEWIRALFQHSLTLQRDTRIAA